MEKKCYCANFQFYLLFSTLSEVYYLGRNHPSLNIQWNSRYPSNWTTRLFLLKDTKLFCNAFSSILLHLTSDILAFILLPEARNTCHKRWIFLPCTWLKKNRVAYIDDLVSTLNTAVIPSYHYSLVLKARSSKHNVSKSSLRDTIIVIHLFIHTRTKSYLGLAFDYADLRVFSR